MIEDGRVTLVGPDVGEVPERSLPFAQVLMAKGSFADEYDSYRDIRDAVYDTRLSGFWSGPCPAGRASGAGWHAKRWDRACR